MLVLNGNNYLLRTPLFSIRQAVKCFEDNEEWMQHPHFLYGLYITSAALYQELQKQISSGSITPKMRQTLQKYWLRSSARCTPYANFAGCASGTYGTVTSIQIGQPDQHKEACRLDMDLVFKLLDALYANTALKSQLRYFSNNSLYRQGRKYRYVRYQISNGKRKYFLSEAEHTIFLQQVIETAATGASFQQLAEKLALMDVEEADALIYLQTLAENQVLQTELEPCISGEQPFERLSRILKNHSASDQFSTHIDSITALLQNNHFNISRLVAVTNQLNTANIDHSSVTTLFQSDMLTNTAANTIALPVVETILQEVDTVLKAVYRKKNNQERLDQFRSRFLARYEMQEVPLCEALDVEYGIGYGNFSNNTASFVSDLDFGKDSNKQQPDFSFLLDQKLAAESSSGSTSIELSEQDIQSLMPGPNPDLQFPWRQSVAIMGSLYGNSGAAIDDGNYRFFVKFISGPSGANLLGRFCHLDAEIEAWVSSITKEEENSLPQNMAFAELIHLPQERTGNILLRPVLRSYEIPWLGNAGSTPDQQLPITDLMVSVRNDQVLLRSKSLNKYIIPRLTSAHNFSVNSLPMYQFLCELQYQQAFSGMMFEDAGNDNALFYPAVTYKHLLLRRAMWRMLEADIKQMPEKEEELINYIEQLRAKRKLPQRVVLLQFDNELLIDFQYPESFRILASYIKKEGMAMVAAFPDETQFGAVQGPDGNHCNELLIPAFIENEKLTVLPDATQHSSTPQRFFLPGDEWLYYKIYCGTHAAEELLAGPTKRLTEAMLELGFAEKFFFIRYLDPEPHIRLRFRLTKNEHFLPVSKAVRNTISRYLNSKMVTSLQIDTYKRELERYGGKLIAEAESIFFHDSQAVLQLLSWLSQGDAVERKWEAAILGVDQYLHDFGFSLPDKISYLHVLQQHFFQDFGGQKSLQLSLNNKYRSLKEPLFKLFSGKEQDALHKKFRQAFTRRSIQNREAVNKIMTDCKRRNQLPDHLLGSFLHMFINRLFATDNKKYELTLYHLLLKYHTSQAAILDKKTI